MFLRPVLRRALSTLVEEIESGVFEAVKAFNQVDSNKLSRASQFSELGLDSLDVVELVVNCEDKLKIELDEEEALKVQSVTELVAAFMKRREAN
jgi:acyl carrier protein